MKNVIQALTVLLLLCCLPTSVFAADMVNPFQLSYADAEGAIGFALSEKGAGQNVAATITGRKNEALYSYNKPLSVEIRGLQFDKAKSQWAASLMFVAGDEVVSAMPVGGRFEEMTEVPVLKHQVRNGELISGQDIELRLFPISSTRTDTVSDMDSLIGKSPLRSISPGRPIRETEVIVPSIIKKNAIVQIRYSSGAMELTTTGQAVDDGAKGTVINVRNTSSKKIVRATVEDENTVRVSPQQIESSKLEEGQHYAAN